ncbi:MAG TPA: Gfo/Idh/MocA family oxidoreductase [Roseimicrobium sp.]|nr:Gfo/Idh/MocA family oxidoreductase [Roseimicrobium sp.]
MNRRDFIQSTTVATLAAAVSTPSLFAAEKKIVLALVGCGHIHTPSFVKLLKGRTDVTVKWIWDHDAERAEKWTKDLGARAVADVKEVWADAEVHGVVICAETNRHHDLVLAAAKAGKHMFVEKPLSASGRESRQMADAIDKAGLLFTTGYFMRTDPKHLFIKDAIAKNVFGKITRVRGSNCHNGSLAGYFDKDWRWMADPKISGVGGFGDLGTHKLDILMWLFGDVESVTADIKIVTSRYEGCDECGEGMIRFKNGITGTLGAGWVDVEDPVQLLVSGTEGHASIVNGQLFIKSKNIPGADGKTPFKDLPAGPQLPMHQWINAIAGQKDQPLVTPREAAERVVVMEAMYAAAKGHKWIKVG